MTEPLCIKIDGAWTALPLRSTEEMVVNGEGISISYEALEKSRADQERLGAFRPDPLPTPPKGKVETGRMLGGDDRPEWVVTYGDAPEPAVPEVVTNYQARAALIGAGLFDRANAAVRASGDAIAVQAWDYANQFYRTSPIIAALAGGLGLKDAEIDDLFRAAAKVT